MRDILFRGKRIDNGEWVEGIPIQTHIGVFICFDENPHYCSQYGYMEIDKIVMVNEATVCQYTGLTDKNGRKIFEGDILCNHYNELFPEDKTMSLIVWDGFGWGIRYRDVVDKLDDFDCKNGEVTGNIFDNADLIRR